MSISHRSVETGTDELLCHIDRRIAVITPDRPADRNALSDRSAPSLRRMITSYATDNGARAVLISGAGEIFCAGGKVKGMGGHRSTKHLPHLPESLR